MLSLQRSILEPLSELGKNLQSMSAHSTDEGLHTTSIRSLELQYRGKVRDIYVIDDAHWLIIATDRVSAFDVILPNVIPGKGKLLTKLAMFWFNRVQAMIPNHLANLSLESILPDPAERAQAEGRCMIVRRLKALPIEAIVRGYIIGSGWKDYQDTGSVCGHTLPEGLQQADKLPQVLFTPATKAELGDHDENISFDTMVGIVGEKLADDIRRVSLALYNDAASYALERGIIIADTKFEFGQDSQGNLVLMDEILTPDSSRFWEAQTWKPGISPPSYDKQYVRDWLETLDWNKTSPGPEVPQEVINGTLERYQEAVDRLTR
ncbi:Phosphoribosylaminoimidazole-succinocarboxamide synthase [Granulosicoccus antarcticus IMCC3135]|uniref:Phosphoribosylaminoimidazole-succinocarboxamide synthase n=2 Tax=Granulosicoccus TaxID=437504 RepID=A0A2Z2NJN4_9GAMM|nr:Phosphoribosylaminoimidazole-succinocarboxamide synthase [Granulosicoccus antarcticus IMCC3135]